MYVISRTERTVVLLNSLGVEGGDGVAPVGRKIAGDVFPETLIFQCLFFDTN